MLRVICVDGSPSDCPAMTPTASPGSAIPVRYFKSMRWEKEEGAGGEGWGEGLRVYKI